MTFAAMALATETILVWTHGTRRARPSAWAWVSGGAVVLVFAAAAVHLAFPLSDHRIGACLVTFLALVMLLVTAVGGMLGLRLLRYVVPVGIACSALFVLAACAEWAAAPHTDNRADTALAITGGGGFVSLLLVKLGRTRIEDEAAVTPLDPAGPGGAVPAASGRVTAALCMVALLTLSAFIGLLMLTYVTAVAEKVSPRGGFIPGDRTLGLAGGAAAVSAVALRWAGRRRAGRDWPAWLVRGCCLAVILALTITVVLDCGSRPLSVLAVAVSVIVGLWNLNSVINNLATLQLRRVTAYMVAVAAGISVLGAAITYWSLVAAVATTAGTRGFAVSATLAISAMMLHILLVSAFPAVGFSSGPHVTEFTIQHNLFQDSLCISAIVLIIEWPAEFLRASSGKWWLAISLSAGLVPLFSAGFLWAIRSNDDHVRRQAQRRLRGDASRVLGDARDEERLDRRLRLLVRAARDDLEGPCDERFIRVLSAHVRNQNLLAYLAILAAIVGALAMVFQSLTDSGWVRRVAGQGRLPRIIPSGQAKP